MGRSPGSPDSPYSAMVGTTIGGLGVLVARGVSLLLGPLSGHNKAKKYVCMY